MELGKKDSRETKNDSVPFLHPHLESNYYSFDAGMWSKFALYKRVLKHQRVSCDSSTSYATRYNESDFDPMIQCVFYDDTHVSHLTLPARHLRLESSDTRPWCTMKPCLALATPIYILTPETGIKLRYYVGIS